MKYALLLLLFLFAGCSLFEVRTQSQTETDARTDSQTVTETVTKSQEVHGGAIVDLVAVTYTTQLSKEVGSIKSNQSQTQAVTSPIVGNVIGAVGGLSGFGGMADATIGIVTTLLARFGFDKIKNPQPRPTPTPQVIKRAYSRKDERDISHG